MSTEPDATPDDARASARRPRIAIWGALLVVLAWLVIGGLGGSAQGKLAGVQSNDNSTFLPKSAESTLVSNAVAAFNDSDTLPYLVVVERMHAYLGDTPATEATLLAIGTATATDQELARVAVAVDDAGRRVDGIVVADPDQGDRTSGRYTMDERSRQVVLPTRLTGVPATDRSAPAHVRTRP